MQGGMQRLGCLWLVFWLIAVNGCAVQKNADQKEEGLGVFFEKMPDLLDDGIYYQGAKIGSIKSRSIGNGNVARVTVVLEEHFMRSAGDNLTFYPRQGKLEAAVLQSFGQPLQNEAVLSGFQSRMDLAWFKFTSLMSDRIAAARERAFRLKQRHGSS